MRQCVCIYRNKKKEGRGWRKREGGMKKGKKEGRKEKKLYEVIQSYEFIPKEKYDV